MITEDDISFGAGEAVMEAADTIEETIAKRNNLMVKSVKDGDVVKYHGTTIDVDNAKWQKEYSAKMDSNLERLKELGLYDKLQELGIVYDEKQFQKNHIILGSQHDRQSVVNGKMDTYDEVERQFDEQEERMKSSESK